MAAHHVSMMFDSLIMNLDVLDLRAIVRGMLSAGPVENASVFKRIAQDRLNSLSDGDLGQLAVDAVLRHARCLLAVGAAPRAMDVLTSAVVPKLHDLEELERTRLDHDIVQAVQSAKEASPKDSAGRAASALRSALLTALHNKSDIQFYTRGLAALSSISDATDKQPKAPRSGINADVPPSSLPKVTLGPLQVPRIFLGLWQLSSPNWGSAPPESIYQDLTNAARLGFTAFDMADHYGDAEILFGAFRGGLQDSEVVRAATKWCVFKSSTMQVTRETVEQAVDERLQRLDSSSIDLLQFHWQEYENKRYIEVLRHLASLRDDGKIKSIGLCNFDTEHLVEVCEALPPGSIVANQVQFSLVDTRPLLRMCAACEKYGVKLLTYGTLCGGLLSDRFLNVPVPNPYDPSFTPSLRKYLDMVNLRFAHRIQEDGAGSTSAWEEFQYLLRTLDRVARAGDISIANVATRWVLDQLAVGAVIIGARLGVSNNLDDNLRVFQCKLSESERAEIDAALNRTDANAVMQALGDCGGEYR